MPGQPRLSGLAGCPVQETGDRRFRVLFGPGSGCPAATQFVGDIPPGRAPPAVKRIGAQSGNTIVAPMHGIVVEMPLQPGEAVTEGTVVAVVEAMKMMNEIRAHRSGRIAKIHAERGATVEAQSPLVTLE